MRQVLDILRGCFATYVAGTVLLFVSELPSALTGPSVFTIWESAIIFAVYGALFAVIATLIVLVLWLILASFKTVVRFPLAPFCGGLIFCWLGLLIGGEIGFVVGFVLGGIAGIHFWYWAFGRIWDVQLRLRSSPRQTAP